MKARGGRCGRLRWRRECPLRGEERRCFHPGEKEGQGLSRLTAGECPLRSEPRVCRGNCGIRGTGPPRAGGRWPRGHGQESPIHCVKGLSTGRCGQWDPVEDLERDRVVMKTTIYKDTLGAAGMMEMEDSAQGAPEEAGRARAVDGHEGLTKGSSSGADRKMLPYHAVYLCRWQVRAFDT